MKELYKKLNDFKSKVGTIKKDGRNPHFKSKYATIESVLETIEQPLNEVGLGFIQCVEDMSLVTTIYDTESEFVMTSRVPLIIGKQDMQQLGSAITYARRYALVSMFGLEQEDDDGNLATQRQENLIPKINELVKIKQVDILKFLNHFKVNNVSELNSQQQQQAIQMLQKK